MARSRNIKPGFFRNADLVELPFEARLLFIGLWTIADRAGRLEDRPKQIKMELFPADNMDCDGLLGLLAGIRMIERYKAGGTRYLQVVNFGKHQNPHKDEKQSTIPPNDGTAESAIEDQGEHRASTMQAQCKHGATSEAVRLIPDSLLLIPEENPCSPSASESTENGFATFWEQYPKKVAKPQALKAWKKIKPAGQTIAHLMAGLERQKASADWVKDGGQFVPHPATWLNGRRWEDEAPAAAGQTAAPARNPIFAGAL
jgi:hypothetical protein